MDIRCGRCNRKLGVNLDGRGNIEIKCGLCKQINLVRLA
jgi:LSD1 subclass zinc finger protein